MARTMTKGGLRIQSAVAAAIFALAHSAPLVAQAGLGHLEDASTAPRGLLRLRAAAAWVRYDARFTASGEQPIGAFLTSDALGSAQLPSLLTLESRVEAAAAVPFALSLGRSRLDATGRDEIIPITFEYGITNRLSVSAMLPVVRRRVAVQLQLDTTGGFIANVGPNPHRTSTGAAFANGQVQSQFLAAQTQLQQLLAQCAANSAQPQCASVNGREGEANALIQTTQIFASDLGLIYGTSTTTGSPFVPSTGSTAQTAIAQRIGTFNALFQDFLGSASNFVTTVPVGAGGPAGVADLQLYFTQELGRDSLVLKEKVYAGDWELSAKFRALDRPANENRRLGMQLAVTGGLRFPTGTRHSGTQIVDLRTGTGKLALLSRGIMDVRLARFGLLAAADFAMAVMEGDSLASPDSRWTELHVAPRVHLSDPFSIYGAYSLRTADVTGGDQLLGAGFSFTTVGSWGGGTLPMEMRYTHLEAISGDAGRPRSFRDQLELRLYYRILKR